jgi:periplasmic copper chaperone A
MKRSIVILAILASLGLFAKAQEPHDLMIVNASAPASLVPTATSAAVYFAIMNHGPVDDELLSVTTPRASSATLHESYIEADVAKMRDLKSIDVPPGGFVELKQGARHIMLTGLSAPLKEGDVLELELIFEKAGKVPIKISIGKAVPDHNHGSGG